MKQQDHSLSEDPNIGDFTTDCLYIAIAACKRSQHTSDRDFANRCELELQQRIRTADRLLGERRVSA